MEGRNAQATDDLLRPRFRIMMWWYYTVVPYLVLRNRCHTDRRGDTGGAVVLATKIRLENGNDHIIMEKKNEMTAVRSKRKLLRWKQETGEIRNKCNILG